MNAAFPPTSRRQALRQIAGATGAIALGGPWSPVALGAGADAPVTGSGRNRIRIGQIGVGHAHATKLEVYRASPDYEVVGVVEPDERLWQKAQHQPAYRGLPRLTRNQLFNVPGVQAVLVETRVRDLLNTAEACITAGFHIHLDKPAGESLSQFKRILAHAERQGRLVQMGYMYRYNPAVQLLREFLRQGWLGEIFEVHTVMSKVVDVESRQAFAEYPGGVLFELGGHVLDLVIAILGQPAKVTGFNQHAARINDDLLDNMLAVLTYPRAIASAKVSAMEVEGFDRRHLVVCGTEGTFHIQPLDNPAARLSLAQARGAYRKGTQEISFPKFTRYVGDAADMAQIIRGEKKADFSPAHDLIVQQTLLKACRR